MQILAGIPTRRRKVGSIIEVIEPFVDGIVVASQKSEVTNTSEKCEVVELEERGICYPRNYLTDIALDLKFDWMFQIDDDLKFAPKLMQHLLDIINSPFKIGAVSSDSRVLAHWSESLVTNQTFKISGVASQLWAVNMNAMREVLDKFAEPAFYIDALEDIRFSMKLWDLGWPVVRLHLGDKLVHHPQTARLSKTDSQGGQYISERNASMRWAIEKMQYFCNRETGVLRFLKPNMKSPDNIGYRIGYNYDVMLRNAVDRWGLQGYEDSKGREF